MIPLLAKCSVTAALAACRQCYSAGDLRADQVVLVGNHGHVHQYRDDREEDHQLDERESGLASGLQDPVLY